MNSSSQVTTSFDWPAKPGHNGLRHTLLRNCKGPSTTFALPQAHQLDGL